MSAKVYVIKDRAVIDFIENNDIDGFRDYLAEEEYPMFDEPVEFETEREALSFCSVLVVEQWKEHKWNSSLSAHSRNTTGLSLKQ